MPCTPGQALHDTPVEQCVATYEKWIATYRLQLHCQEKTHPKRALVIRESPP